MKLIILTLLLHIALVTSTTNFISGVLQRVVPAFPGRRPAASPTKPKYRPQKKPSYQAQKPKYKGQNARKPSYKPQKGPNNKPTYQQRPSNQLKSQTSGKLNPPIAAVEQNSQNSVRLTDEQMSALLLSIHSMMKTIVESTADNSSSGLATADSYGSPIASPLGSVSGSLPTTSIASLNNKDQSRQPSYNTQNVDNNQSSYEPNEVPIVKSTFEQLNQRVDKKPVRFPRNPSFGEILKMLEEMKKENGEDLEDLDLRVDLFY